MEEKKSTYRGNTDAQRRASSKYLAESVESFSVRVPKGRKEHYQAAAAAAGLSLNQFVVDALDEKIERDQLGPKE